MAMIARKPVWVSWQNTTCSCPLRAVGEDVGVPWGYAGALPCGLLANTLVTVVALLARPASSSTRARDKRMPLGWPEGAVTIRRGRAECGDDLVTCRVRI